MADGNKSSVSEAVDSVLDKFKNLPAAQDASPAQDTSPESAQIPSSNRLFGRQRSVHELLGGGRAADVILWKKPLQPAAILACVTVVYIMFEWRDFRVLPLLSISLLIILGALFLWSNLAALVKRSPLNLPQPQITEETALRIAAILKEEADWVMGNIHEVILGKDIKLFLQIELILWMLSIIGKWADFLTLVYLGVLFILIVPALYDRHQEKVDGTLQQGFEHTRGLFGKLQDQIATRAPQLASRQKKAE